MLIGSDVLPDDQKLIIETAKVIRVGFLQQNAFHKEDTYVPMDKQLAMMRAIIRMHDLSGAAISSGVPLAKIIETGLFDRLVRMKYDVPNDEVGLIDYLIREIEETITPAM